jgi:crotonobetainyl-CoA:carnitine CoA-transferase CaiB-like acyl-CoA transferase
MVPRLTPFGVYEAADGYLAICAPTDQFARGVFAAIGRPELERDARYGTRDARVANKEAVNDLIEGFTRSRPTAELVPLFELHGVPAAPVRTPADAVRDPRVLARGETVAIEHPQLGRVADLIGPGLPIRFSDAEPAATRPAPTVGQDNALVYADWLGYSAATIERLRAAGNI